MSWAETGTRAREPDASGVATTADGLGLYWEIHGGGSTTVVLLPASPISHSRLWKGQVHYLARHHRVLVYDGRGNGRSDHPDPDALWLDAWRADDCLTVMDAAGVDRAVLVGICNDGVWPSAQLAAAHPERVLGIVALAPGVPSLTPPHPWRAAALETFEQPLENPQGWEKINRRYMLDHPRGFAEFFFGELLVEPHSEKVWEDAVAYALDAPSGMLVMDDEIPSPEDVEDTCRRVNCPVLVLQCEHDNCQPPERARRFAELTGAEYVVLAGAGHVPCAREPVVFNRLVHSFAARFDPPRSTRPRPAGRRALLVSSPIGLGHAWRDVAIARALRERVPGLEVEWLAQAPLTTLLRECGETVHPASAELAPEAAGVDADTGEHALHAFQMLRRLDEIFCANFMVFHDVVAQERFDVWIADEAWEVDYFLHENPELKTAPYVWLTDFVGVLPMPGGGERETFLAADWNAQMVEHVAAHPGLRDRSIFIGDPEDVVDAPLGPGLPGIVEWTREHFAFSGYVTAFSSAEIADRAALRAELGWGDDETVCVVAAGGSAAGAHLLERAAAAAPLVPGVRMVVVGGPRVDLGARADVETHGYVHQLYRQLAACDVAVCHGGLSTTMELTAAGRPFLFFPLRDHFEQNRHVAHRLARHGAGRRMEYAQSSPETIAAALVEELARTPHYQPVPDGGAARAAALIAEALRPA